jgi:hypothetical protein
MIFLLTLLMFCCQANEYLVKDTTPISRKTYQIKVNEKDAGSFTGYLHEITDSSISVSVIRMPFGKIPETKKLISYSNINTITVRKEGSVGDGFLYGALSGAVLGVILGVAATPENVGFGIFIFGLLFLGIGGLIGAVLGGNKHTYKINKNKENFQAMREKMWLKIYPQKKNQ